MKSLDDAFEFCATECERDLINDTASPKGSPTTVGDWSATYRFDDPENESWRSCRILDISPMGAGLELCQVQRDEGVQARITIAFELSGIGRSVMRGGDHRTARFGIEFPELNEAAKHYLSETRGVAW